MPVKKEVCRSFQRGSCQYGERCKFLHVTQQQQQPNQSSNPFGFGVGNKQQQFKPFENKWTRFSPISNSGTPSQQPDNQPQTANHKCTDPESCKRQIAEDFEHEKPLWKLTCYGHSKNGPCDIVGDVSFEELRAAAYDDAKCGLTLQSIVEKERNLLSSKLIEFENLLHNPHIATRMSALSQSRFSSGTPDAISTTGHNNAPPSVSSFSQLGASLNMETRTRPSVPFNNVFGQPNLFSNSSQTSSAFGIRPSAPSNNVFRQPNVFSNLSQTSSAFGTNGFMPGNAGSLSSQLPNQASGSPFSFNTVGISNSIATSNQHNAFSSAASMQVINSASNAVGQASKHIQNGMQRVTVSADASIWLKENWNPGEIPEDAPPDEYIR